MDHDDEVAHFCENSTATFRNILFGKDTNDTLAPSPAFYKLTLDDLLERGSHSSANSLATSSPTKSLAKRRKQCNSVESFCSSSSNSCSSSSYTNDDYEYNCDGGLTLQILLQDSYAPPYASAFKGQVQRLTRNKVAQLRKQGGEQIIKPGTGFLFPRFGSIKVSRENITRTIYGKKEVIKNWDVDKDDNHKTIEPCVQTPVDEITTTANNNDIKVNNEVQVTSANEEKINTRSTICTEKKARKLLQDDELRQYVIKNIGSDQILTDVYEELDPNVEISELDLMKELADIHLFIKIMTKKNIDSRISNGKLQSLVNKFELLAATTDDRNKDLDHLESSVSKRKMDKDNDNDTNTDESGVKRKLIPSSRRKVYGGRKGKRS